MRIWIVNHYALPPGSRGGPTRHLGISRGLRDLGHEVTIVASLFDHYARLDHRPRAGTGWQREDIDGVTYLWVPTPRYGSTAQRAINMAAFARRAASVRMPGAVPEVVIGSSPHLLAPLAAKRIAREAGAGFVLEVRDLWPESLVDLGEMSSRHPGVLALRMIERHLYRTADEVVTVLPGARDYFTARGVAPDRLHVVPNGVSVGDPPVRPPPDPDRRFTAVYAGTMGLANGLDVALEAARVLARRGRTDIHIRLVGAGPERPDLARAASTLANLSVEPPVAAEQVPELLATADAGLLVLRDSAVFRWGVSPTKLFDYMAAGLPIITSVPAPSDMASDVGAGVRAVPGDGESLASGLEHVADLSEPERRGMGALGRAHVVEHHSFEALARKVEGVAQRARERNQEMRR